MSFYRQGPYRPSGMGFAVPRLTPMVKLVIVACVAMWFVQILSARALEFPLEPWLGLVPARVLRGYVHQPLTYLFLHDPAQLFHILFNMLVVWLFGSELEALWGSRGFLRFYLVCGVGAGLFSTALGWLSNPWVPVIGASGAIYGLIVAYGMVFAQRTILFMFVFPMTARVFAWLMFAIAFVSSIDAGSSQVAHIAHLGGAVTGYLYLKRAWRVGEFYRELRWKIRRRRFKVMTPEDPDDRWIH